MGIEAQIFMTTVDVDIITNIKIVDLLSANIIGLEPVYIHMEMTTVPIIIHMTTEVN